MAIVITNGTYYIATNKSGGIIKTPILEEAQRFYNVNVASRKMRKAPGKCCLCGRQILLKDMTIDHIVPLAMNGADLVENLQCTCADCNQFKSNILLDDFMERITTIFLYQMDKKHHDKWMWKISHKILGRLL